jgi:hypothetical protein
MRPPAGVGPAHDGGRRAALPPRGRVCGAHRRRHSPGLQGKPGLLPSAPCCNALDGWRCPAAAFFLTPSHHCSSAAPAAPARRAAQPAACFNLYCRVMGGTSFPTARTSPSSCGTPGELTLPCCTSATRLIMRVGNAATCCADALLCIRCCSESRACLASYRSWPCLPASSLCAA